MRPVFSTLFATSAKTFLSVAVLLPTLGPITTAQAQTLPPVLGEIYGLHRTSPDFTRPLPPPEREAIIRNFIAAETTFRETLLQFSFKRDVVLQTIGLHGEVTGEYLRSSGFVLDDQGNRIERVLYHPASTLKQLKITKEDVQDLSGSQLFGLEPAEMDSYNFSHLGEQTLNGRAVHLIAVSPKQAPDPHRMRLRFFVGKIWIDAVTFQIVKLQGITEPHGKQRFPAFETQRNLKIEELQFPSITSADDVLRFPQIDIHYRIAVRYYDFKRFAGRLKIVDVDEEPGPEIVKGKG
jgi:hypothetical protein